MKLRAERADLIEGGTVIHSQAFPRGFGCDRSDGSSNSWRRPPTKGPRSTNSTRRNATDRNSIACSDRRRNAFSLAFLGEASHLLIVLDFRITMEARNPAGGCLRHYRVEAGTDLFGVWVVQISYGRIGSVGCSRSYVVRDEAEARRLTQSILKRRATAPRRIGVPYRTLELIDPAGWVGSCGSIAPKQEEDSTPRCPMPGERGRAEAI